MSDQQSETTPPPASDGADFALYIDFVRGEGNPSRVFQAADAMIRALQQLDRALCSSIDSHIEPILVLEEIEAGSLKIWLRDVLKATDDEAIKKLDWKTAVGNFLVKAKYVYIEWSNKKDDGSSILDLANELRTLATSTDIKHLPDYAPPSVTELSEVTKQIDTAKGFLLPNKDQIAYVPAARGTALVPAAVSFDLTVRWAAEELLALSTKETTRYENMPMNLIIKRPDYLGASKWDFRHGKTPLSAKIADEEWLHSFQSRKVDVRPGDALKCIVTLERSYGFDNELIEETYTVTKVTEVLQNQFRQISFFEDNTP